MENNTFIRRLEKIQRSIDFICRRRNVDPENIEMRVDEFSEDEVDRLHTFLQQKLELQKAIYKLQGGDLSNVIFLQQTASTE